MFLPMKIAHVCPFYNPVIGGVRQVVEELSKRQKALGHEVHVYTSDWDKTKKIRIVIINTMPDTMC